MIISIAEVLELNNFLKPYNTKIHLHDTCGGQVLSIEGENNDEIITQIEDWFEKNKVTIKISSDKKYIHIK